MLRCRMSRHRMRNGSLSSLDFPPIMGNREELVPEVVLHGAFVRYAWTWPPPLSEV